jgi:putative ABC transport system ATP-binding protein
MPQPPSARSERGAREPAAPLVTIDQVSKAYPSGPRETRVLDSISMELARGETTSLTGVSGSGKSTLISLLAGLMPPDSGRVLFDGEDLTKLDDSGRAWLRARRIGVVMQRGNLIPFLTAAENVELAITLAGGDRPAQRARALLGEVGIAGRGGHLARRLSGGEAQRASVAMAMANGPDLLLADEVTGELDSAAADEIMRVIVEAARDRGVTVLFVTHSDELAGRAQQRLRLEAGKVRPL